MSLLKFNGKEVVDFAVMVEQKGEELYRKLAAKSDDAKATELFHALSVEEREHQEDFAKLGEGLATSLIRESYDGEYEDYVNTIVESHLMYGIDQVDQLLKDIDGVKSSLALALVFEKDSLLFFTELLNFVNEDGKKIVLQLIKAEQQHLARLSKLLK